MHSTKIVRGRALDAKLAELAILGEATLGEQLKASMHKANMQHYKDLLAKHNQVRLCNSTLPSRICLAVL